MQQPRTSESFSPRPLADAVLLSPEKVLNPRSLGSYGGIREEAPVLVVLAAGAGTRFGASPKCIQPVQGKPLARHSIDAFRGCSPSPVICVVGYRWEAVSAALGTDNIYVRSDNPTGGTAFAAYEALSVGSLAGANPLLIIAMGDRIVPTLVFARLLETHCALCRGKACLAQATQTEADLTFLTAVYEPPKNRGKGRVLRDESRRVLRIVEERDIAAQANCTSRQALLDLTEGNCPLYAIRAVTLARHLKGLTNANAQGQYYLTDIVESISRAGGEIRTVTTTPADPEYNLLCSDVTRPADLAVVEGLLASAGELPVGDVENVEEAARAIMADRPTGQVASIARQLEELHDDVRSNKLRFEPDRPVAIGISGGRLRIAFMHPDMVRFFGPAWQMPIGAVDAQGSDQIVMLAQGSADRRIHLFPMNPDYRRTGNAIPSDNDAMYPGEDVCDLHTYEQFGTAMSENLLRSLGYFSDDDLRQSRQDGRPLPPPARWISNNMRHPFPLVGNAIASMRTLRGDDPGERVRRHLGRKGFAGLSMVLTGNIPQGGFSSSSAVTVATLNATNALYGIGIPPDVLVDLACQAEYGTGVRAGSLDQATEQKGRAGQGTLISSNPKDGYRIMGTYKVPTDRFRIIFPYSVDRDRDAWRWSWGAYAEAAGDGPLTTGETRKMTGKTAEIAAVLTHLPLETDFFKQIEGDLVSDGLLSRASRAWICSVLRQLPLLVELEDLHEQITAHRDWCVGQLTGKDGLDTAAAAHKADTLITSLFKGWREPVLRRTTPGGEILTERGVPLRAMVAYLFGEVAKNFHLIHHTDQWIEYVTRSQRGDCCVDIPADALPPREAMESQLRFEQGLKGPDVLDRWLEHCGATPFDYNRGLDDASLTADNPPDFTELEGSNFFRGLALIDLAEAMLKRAFGPDAVAVRINAAGQGDYWQVHVDTQKADPEDVKQFIRKAVYRRFGLSPDPEFVQLHSGGGAAGVRLNRYDSLPQLIQCLRR
jgi:CTP:molybdopterin cytidylyltransferase MocA